MNKQFTYSVLQYKHSLALGEALNIGVLFSFPEEEKVYFIPGNTQRVKCVYPNFDTTIFHRISKNIKAKVRESNLFEIDLVSRERKSFREYINSQILPKDSTSLQFSEPYTALNDTGSTKTTIDEFSKLLLPWSEDIDQEVKHNEPYIIKSYQERLLSRVDKNKLDNRLRRDVEVKTKKAELNFEIAWKNETLLHLVKPISFDLTGEYFIKEKAVKFWGHLSLLNKYAQEKGYYFDLLVAAPQQQSLNEAYQNALDVLTETDAPKRIITEDKWDEYSEETAVNINKELL